MDLEALRRLELDAKSLLSSISSLIQTGEDDKATIDTLTRQIEGQTAREVELVHEIKTLKEEIATLKPESKPPIEVAPNIAIELGDEFLRPGLDYDRQGREKRYSIPYNDEIDILIDCKDDEQVGIILERCRVNTSPEVVSLPLSIKIGGRPIFENFIRLHHHTRPRIVDTPSSSYPITDSILALLPNYSPGYEQIRFLDATKRALAGAHPWMTWKGKAKPYDPLTEEYGLMLSSWVGGAGALLNEAAHLTPLQSLYLFTQNQDLWSLVRQEADSSGNYPIHYRDNSGKFPRADENINSSSMPFLQSASTVTLKSLSGETLPIPDVAHQHNLCYLSFLLTGDRYYREELEAWTGYNLLTRPKDDWRQQGIVWSGQVRAAAWALRALLHSWVAETAAVGYAIGRGPEIYNEIKANLKFMNDRFVNPTSSEHRPNGVVSIVPFRPSPFLANAAPNTPYYFSTWTHYVLTSVLNEYVRMGFQEAAPMRNHVLNVIRGSWNVSNLPPVFNPHLFAWGNHAYPSGSPDVTWPQILNTTFTAGKLPPAGAFSSPPLTPDYVAWARSAVIAAIDAGNESVDGEGDYDSRWAHEALTWIDREAPKYKGSIPINWMINPVPGK